MVTCATGTLQEYTNQWDKKRLLHLFNRIGYGLKASKISTYLNMTPQAVVGKILNDAQNETSYPAPVWANWNLDDYDNLDQQVLEQYYELILAWQTG